MAGLPWIELDVDLPQHPKSIRLGRRLKNPIAWAHVVQLWTWCAKHLPQGVIEGEDASEMVEEAAGWAGKAGVFTEAAVSVGFLDLADGGIVVHGWKERATPHILKRERDAARAKERRESLGRPRDVAETQPGLSSDVSGDPTRQPTNQTKPDPTRPDQPASGRPPAAGHGVDLGSVREALAARLGIPRVSVGRDRDRVERSFARWLQRGLEEPLLAECVRLAEERGERPANLTWWPGWLDTVPDAELDRLATTRSAQ